MFLLLDLPNGIAPPVQIFNLENTKAIINWILLPILIGILIYLIYYFKNAQRTIFKKQRKIFTIETNVFLQKLAKLHQDKAINFQFREGLHLLAQEMKHYYESKTGFPIEEMTYKEITKTIKQTEIIKFFKTLTTLQFQKSEPLRTEFDEIFEEAKALVNKKKVSTVNLKNSEKIEIMRPSL